jgi:hypothetical protein
VTLSVPPKTAASTMSRSDPEKEVEPVYEIEEGETVVEALVTAKGSREGGVCAIAGDGTVRDKRASSVSIAETLKRRNRRGSTAH